MIALYIIGGIIAAGIIINFISRKSRSDSTYMKIKKKLDEDLLQANFSGDWKRRQEITLQLLWLKTIKEVETSAIFGRSKSQSERSILSKLTLDDIKFPVKWKLDDFYCYPLSQKITSVYGKVLADNDYKGLFKPDSILPVPKKYIRKAILFTLDYIDLEDPIYKVPNKDKLVHSLNNCNAALYMFFIDTGNTELPKSGIENSQIGNLVKEKLPDYDQLEDLSLIDWRTETDWIVRGINYADNEQFRNAFACFEEVKKINPDNKEIDSVVSLTYLEKGEKHYENGEHEIGLEDIRKAAELKNDEAVEWLEAYANQKSKSKQETSSSKTSKESSKNTWRKTLTQALAAAAINKAMGG